jgi:hypothetical protein
MAIETLVGRRTSCAGLRLGKLEPKTTNLRGISCRTVGRNAAGLLDLAPPLRNERTLARHSSRTTQQPQAWANQCGFSAMTTVHRDAFCLHTRARLSTYPAIPPVSQVLRSTMTRGSSANFTSTSPCNGFVPIALHAGATFGSGSFDTEVSREIPIGGRCVVGICHPPSQPLQTHELADSQSRRFARRGRAEARTTLEGDTGPSVPANDSSCDVHRPGSVRG